MTVGDYPLVGASVHFGERPSPYFPRRMDTVALWGERYVVIGEEVTGRWPSIKIGPDRRPIGFRWLTRDLFGGVASVAGYDAYDWEAAFRQEEVP